MEIIRNERGGSKLCFEGYIFRSLDFRTEAKNGISIFQSLFMKFFNSVRMSKSAYQYHRSIFRLIAIVKIGF